jgi:hypothetical protein
MLQYQVLIRFSLSRQSTRAQRIQAYKGKNDQGLSTHAQAIKDYKGNIGQESFVTDNSGLVQNYSLQYPEIDTAQKPGGGLLTCIIQRQQFQRREVIVDSG